MKFFMGIRHAARSPASIVFSCLQLAAAFLCVLLGVSLLSDSIALNHRDGTSVTTIAVLNETRFYQSQSLHLQQMLQMRGDMGYGAALSPEFTPEQYARARDAGALSQYVRSADTNRTLAAWSTSLAMPLSQPSIPYVPLLLTRDSVAAYMSPVQVGIREKTRWDYLGDGDASIPFLIDCGRSPTVHGGLETAWSRYYPFVKMTPGGVDEIPAPDDTGEMWQAIMTQSERRQNSFPVVATDDADSLVTFNRKMAAVTDGRAITDEEYAEGAKVCMVSASFARFNGIEPGDGIDLAFFNEGYTVMPSAAGKDELHRSAYRYGENPEQQPEEYTVAGIYTLRGQGSGAVSTLPAHAVIVPNKSLGGRYMPPVRNRIPSAGGRAALNNSDFDFGSGYASERYGMYTLVLQPYSAALFEEEMAAQGLGGMYTYYDVDTA